MVEDVVPGLLEDIQNRFRTNLNKSQPLQRVRQRMEAGTATLRDVHTYTENVGFSLSDALRGALTPDKLPDGRLWYNIADRTLGPMVRQSYDMSNQVATEILEARDRAEGLGLNAVTADYPEDRVSGLVRKAADAADAGEDWARWFGEPVVNLVESMADSFMKANADFREKLGMSPKIRRDSYARCCDWCADLAGTYDYHDTPDEIYARHEFCRCVVTFENGRERQNVWTKERWTADQDELDRRREYGLTDERERGIVKAAGSRPGWVDPIPSAKQPIQQGFEAFPANDILKEYVKRVNPDGDFFDVAMHGSPTGVCFGTTKPSMTARELARVILRDPEYHGQGIRLLSCDTGKMPKEGLHCFAEELSNALNVTVKAPEDKLFIQADGTWYVNRPAKQTLKTFTPNQRGLIK